MLYCDSPKSMEEEAELVQTIRTLCLDEIVRCDGIAGIEEGKIRMLQFH